ncbi:hypothetical protein FQN57_001670 [Myotisia sp. PD_48]|nr:hypothetical protein FQN57_001670 [Myotisia sp. PD_48]
MAMLGQTISVIDKSGKVVSTSKHLFGVFKEARTAYKERKASIRSEERAKQAEREARRALAAYSIQDGHSTTSSKRHPGRSKSVSRHGGHHQTGERSHRRRSSVIEDLDLDGGAFYPGDGFQAPRYLPRRHTTQEITTIPKHLHSGKRSNSSPHIDMNLAYGEFHPSALEKLRPETPEDMSGLVGKVKGLLTEADCAQHSVSAIMAHLQKHPDAMAAVALTLAEISNLATKLGPSALVALRNSAPAVFALLASPQFMIAAGVGIGMTVVMFGGYKIVKQIKAAKQIEQEGGMDELMELNELNRGMSRVEGWRRGVADSEAESVGTSVDGEFITPTAAAMSRAYLPQHDRISELRGIPPPPPSGTDYETGSSYTRHSRASKSSRRSSSSKASDGTEKSKKHRKDKEKKEKKDKKDKSKKLSPLRLLFK